MEDDKAQSTDGNISQGQLAPPVNKSIDFGEVPPKLNVAGEIFLRGNVPPPTNVSGELIIKGMAPGPMPKIPLDQIAQPSQPSGGSADSSVTSSNQAGQSSDSDKK